jgi:shikimate dehydrogenase
MKFLDENSKEALLMGAVNTIKNIDGRFYGYNTDAEGFSRSFKEETGTVFKDREVVLLGAGGSARSIAVKIAIEGARKINIINRTVSKAADIAEIVNNNIKPVVSIHGSDDDTARDVFKKSSIIINTTSAGMHPEVNAIPIGKGFATRPCIPI